MVIDDKVEQPSKARTPINVTDDGIVIDVKVEHSRKESSPIDVTVYVTPEYNTVSGNVILPVSALPVVTSTVLTEVVLYLIPFEVNLQSLPMQEKAFSWLYYMCVNKPIIIYWYIKAKSSFS